VEINFMQSRIMTDEFKTELQNRNAMITKEKDLIAELEERANTYKAAIAKQDFAKIPDSDQINTVNESLIDTLTKIHDETPWSKIK